MPILRPLSYCLIALLIIALAILAGASIGETFIPFTTSLKAIANGLWHHGFVVDRIDGGIVWNYRFFRAVAAACCGASLAMCGVILQALLRNPLAEPYLLGISAGASTGAVCVGIWGIGVGFLTFSAGAFIGALCAFGLVLVLSLLSGRNTNAIILSGIATAALFTAMSALVITLSADPEQARAIMFWLLGNLSGVRADDVVLAIPVTLLAFGVCFYYAHTLDAFAFGSRLAASMGVNVALSYALLVITCALTTAVMVSLVGTIGFVGLVIPHAARLVVGGQHRTLIPMSALIGAIFLIAADIISRILVPGRTVPIGVITALVGAPVFALILLRKGKRK